MVLDVQEDTIVTFNTFINLFQCITFARIWNMLLILSSFRLSLLLKRSIVWGKPYTITIEPTNHCNLECPECPSGNGQMVRPLGSMTIADFKRIVDEIARETFYIQLFFQGEPFINKHLLEMIGYAKRKKMYVSVSTNAHFFKRQIADRLVVSGLDRLIISIDGLTDDVYQDYRVGGKLQAVLEGLDTLSEVRKSIRNRMEVVLQFLVTKRNEHQIPDLRALARSHGATVALKTMQVYSAESAQHFLPTQERFRRYRIENGELVTKNKMGNRCVRLWERSVITWDGVVVPCCFDKNAHYPLGRVNGRSFSEAWQSETYHEFRTRILSNRKGIDMCRNCTEGLRVYR